MGFQTQQNEKLDLMFYWMSTDVSCSQHVLQKSHGLAATSHGNKRI